MITHIRCTLTFLCLGPPDEPAGVYVESNSIVGTSLRLMWTWSPFANHGYPVNYFVVEAHTEFNSSWIVLAEGNAVYVSCYY